MSSSLRARATTLLRALSLPTLLAACGGGGGGAPPEPVVVETSAGCLACHVGLDQPDELVHERFELGCTECHGGDATATDLARAHVAPKAPVVPGDHVAPRDGDLPYLRFVNPSDFRVQSQTCGRSGDGTGTNCHQTESSTVIASLMATNAGLFQGLGFETGFFASRTPGVGVFGATDDDGVVPAERGAVASLAPVGPEDASLPIDSAARHASALPRESCVRCHLWSTGAGVRGESGHAGLYRSQGCAACHYEYADDGLYAGLDPTIDKKQPGHGVGHRLRLAIPTTQCAHCHNSGGADVGLSFQGLAEVPPGIPAGPGFAGTTDETRYGAYHLSDGFFVQPDVHSQAGLACIDCHTVLEAHGDGNVDVQMSFATEIRCEDCHGTLEADTTFVTSRGNPLTHLRKEGDFYFLRGKLDGADHLLKQVRQVIEPSSPVFNPSAADAMTAAHLRPPGQGGLECYACHAPWQPSHYATVLERDFAASGVDLVTGAPTPAAIANAKAPYPSRTGLLRFRPFGLGRNARGRAAPFVPSRGGVLATATDPVGATVADAATPISVDGRIGLGHQSVFPHTIRNGARTCDECHRNPAAVGLGGEGIFLARRLGVAAAGPDGVAILDRTNPANVALVSRLGATGARDAVLVLDAATGRARTMAVAQGVSGVLLVDVTTPESPVPVAGLPTTDARGLALSGSTLLVADGPGGVLLIDVSTPESPRLLAAVPTADARAITVGFPFAYVADGAAGLAVIDVSDPTAPFLAETIDLNGEGDAEPNDARDVAVVPLLTPIQSTDKPYQTIALVADGASGLRAIDVTTPEFRFPLGTFPTSEASGVAHASVFIAGDDSFSPRETDLIAVADPVDGLHLVELGTFGDLLPLGLVAEAGFSPVACAIGFDPGRAGGMRLLAHAATANGELRLIDVTDPLAPAPAGLASVAPGGALGSIALEAIDLSRRVAEDGREILERPFPEARPFDAAEILAILRTVYP